jgi:hypothetical protein
VFVGLLYVSSIILTIWRLLACNPEFKYNIPKNRKTSLILLKNKALKLAFIVPRRVCQKLIKKKEESPMDSQPKNRLNKLLDKTKKIMLNINQLISRVNISSLASYLK